MRDRQQVVDDGEARAFPAVGVALVVDAAAGRSAIGSASAGSSRSVVHRRDEVAGAHLDRELAAVDDLRFDALAERGARARACSVSSASAASARRIVLVRQILFCSWMMP